MDLRKATSRIVFAFLAVIMAGSMMIGCSSDEFEGPRKTLATRSTMGTEPGNYVRVTDGSRSLSLDGTDSKVFITLSWKSGNITPNTETLPTLTVDSIVPNISDKFVVLEHSDSVRTKESMWIIFDINNVMHETCEQYRVPILYSISYDISIIRRNLENGVVDTLTQSPTVSALEHVNAYPVEH